MDKGDNFIHVKLSYEEALQSKKDILASEIDIINIIKSIKRFLLLRDLELKMKSSFYKEVKKIAMNVKLLEADLPEVRIPKILKRPQENEEENSTNRVSGDLESQLREIQRKLKSLSY
ncbi:MAG: hypothetical protein WAU65_00215 [Candidatus Nanoarchaeia archaeon]